MGGRVTGPEGPPVPSSGPDTGANMERVVGTVSGGGLPGAVTVEAWVRTFTGGSGVAGWEGHFEGRGGAVPHGEYDLAVADGRRGRIRVTHVGLSGRYPARAEFTGVGPFH